MSKPTGSSTRTSRTSSLRTSSRRQRNLFDVPVWIILLTLISLAASACLGQKNDPPQISRALDPRTVAEFEVQGWAWTDDPENSISPDGKYLLAIINNEEHKAVTVIPVEGETHDPKILHEAPAGWAQYDGLDYRTLGWTGDGRPLFLVFGYQNRGPNTGKRGVGIWSGGAGEGEAEELAFIDLPGENLQSSVYLTGQDKVFISVSAAIYSYDLKSSRIAPVKTGLPEYDDLFYASLSPSGKHFVYELYEEGKRGIYILDAGTGKEEVLLATGQSFSFVPLWSPDGKYVAAYTADLKAGADGTSFEDYDCFLGAAGPLTIAPAITIADTSGKVVQTIRVEGKYLANMRWSPDSSSIAFVAGDKAGAEENQYDEMGIPDITWDGVWIAGIGAGAGPREVASLTPSDSEALAFAYPCDFDTAGSGVFYQYGDMESISVWYAGPGKDGSTDSTPSPVKVADGYWHPQYSNPKFGEYLGVLISGDEMTELWLLGPEMRKVDGWSAASITGLLGFNEDTMLLFHKEEAGPPKILVISVYE